MLKFSDPFAILRFHTVDDWEKRAELLRTMYSKNKQHVNQKLITQATENDLKITGEELKQHQVFAHLVPQDQELLTELVYNLSKVLYKTFLNEQD